MNLNQIAAKLHATGELDEGLAAALAYYQATLVRLDALAAALDPTSGSGSSRR